MLLGLGEVAVWGPTGAFEVLSVNPLCEEAHLLHTSSFSLYEGLGIADSMGGFPLEAQGNEAHVHHASSLSLCRVALGLR